MNRIVLSLLHFPHQLKIILALLLLVPHQALQAQFVFPDLLPPETIGTISSPDMWATWKSVSSLTGSIPASNQEARDRIKEITQQLGYPLDAPSLLGKMLLAGDLAVTLPGLSGDVSTLPDQSLSSQGDREPGLLWLTRVGDMDGWQKALGKMEAFLLTNSATPSSPLTRSVEHIGDSQIVLLCDVGLTLGHLLNTNQKIWALSTDPAALRYVARKLSTRGQAHSTEVIVPQPLKRAHAAWTKQFSPRESNTENLCYLFSAPNPAFPATGNGVVASLLNFFRPTRDSAGVIRTKNGSLHIENIARYTPAEDTPLDQAFSTLPATALMPACRLASPDALLLGGTNLFDPALVRRALAALIENVGAGLPLSQQASLAPASFLARARLASLYAQISDPELIADLGPDVFYILNHFRFGKAGEFPDVDLQIGIHSRNEAKTRLRMYEVEQNLIDAMLKLSPQTSAADMTIPEFRTANLVLPAGGTISVRVLTAPGLPQTLRPCWAVHNEYLLLSLSPEALTRALKRSDLPLDEKSEKILALMGMRDTHTYHIAAPSLAMTSLEPLLIVAARRLSPALGANITTIIDEIKAAQTAILLSKGDKTGIHTIARIDFQKNAKSQPSP